MAASGQHPPDDQNVMVMWLGHNMAGCKIPFESVLVYHRISAYNFMPPPTCGPKVLCFQVSCLHESPEPFWLRVSSYLDISMNLFDFGCKEQGHHMTKYGPKCRLKPKPKTSVKKCQLCKIVIPTKMVCINAVTRWSFLLVGGFDTVGSVLIFTGITRLMFVMFTTHCARKCKTWKVKELGGAERSRNMPIYI